MLHSENKIQKDACSHRALSSPDSRCSNWDCILPPQSQLDRGGNVLMMVHRQYMIVSPSFSHLGYSMGKQFLWVEKRVNREERVKWGRESSRGSEGSSWLCWTLSRTWVKGGWWRSCDVVPGDGTGPGQCLSLPARGERPLHKQDLSKDSRKIYFFCGRGCGGLSYQNLKVSLDRLKCF